MNSFEELALFRSEVNTLEEKMKTLVHGLSGSPRKKLAEAVQGLSDVRDALWKCDSEIERQERPQA